MKFQIFTQTYVVPEEGRSSGYLIPDQWDDWFKYNTMYTLIVDDQDGVRHHVGSVKIGQFEMRSDQRRADVPEQFDALDDRFFSIGQDDSYYETLNKLGAVQREAILTALRDFAFDLALFERAKSEDVTEVSLLRSVTPAGVQGQFRRMALGGARLSGYRFSYASDNGPESPPSGIRLEFEVKPESQPPTNIHVLIGRNGVGKTRLLKRMTSALFGLEVENTDAGLFEFDHDRPVGGTQFANVVSVSFSAFDPFFELNRSDRSVDRTRYVYVGLRDTEATSEMPHGSPLSPEQLSSSFAKSMWQCRQGARAMRWRRALEMLEADPIFKDVEVASSLAGDEAESEFQSRASSFFSRLSSGHKIVLLTITRLVETVEERTLVLIDEPEGHLHPPLLSAFIRALSDLLINRNGVGIIATHSPVVLQEVPRSCVWKLQRVGTRMQSERPEIETFGENVGILTREIFGLEVTDTGFHSMLRDAVAEGDDYDDTVARFDGQLGGEAKAIIRALIAVRQSDGT